MKHTPKVTLSYSVDTYPNRVVFTILVPSGLRTKWGINGR